MNDMSPLENTKAYNYRSLNRTKDGPFDVTILVDSNGKCFFDKGSILRNPVNLLDHEIYGTSSADWLKNNENNWRPNDRGQVEILEKTFVGTPTLATIISSGGKCSNFRKWNTDPSMMSRNPSPPKRPRSKPVLPTQQIGTYRVKGRRCWGDLKPLNGLYRGCPCQYVAGEKNSQPIDTTIVFKGTSEASKYLLGHAVGNSKILDVNGLAPVFSPKLQSQRSSKVRPNKSEIIDTLPKCEETPSRLLELCSHVNTPETITALNQHIRRYLEGAYPLKYNKKYTLEELLSRRSAGAKGQFYSALSTTLTEKIKLTLQEENMDFIPQDVDGIDWVFNQYEGDFKIGFTYQKSWTSNGSSKKRGYLILWKFILDDSATLDTITIKALFCGVIHSKFISNIRGTGKSDMSQISIPIQHYHQFHILAGSKDITRTKVIFSYKLL